LGIRPGEKVRQEPKNNHQPEKKRKFRVTAGMSPCGGSKKQYFQSRKGKLREKKKKKG